MRKAEFNPWRQFTEFNFLGWEWGFGCPDRILIHGAGWSGLCLGLFLKSRGFNNFKIFEPHRVGGLIQTTKTGLGIREWAANGFLSQGEGMQELIATLGLDPVSSREESNRKYIVRRGSLQPLPSSAKEFFTQPFVTPTSKLLLIPRLLKFLLWARPSPRWSMEELMRRALGAEFSGSLAPALVAGIYGGSAQEICIGTAFPRIYARFEKMKTSKKGKPQLQSFQGGMGECIESLEKSLQEYLCSTLPDWSVQAGERILHVSTVPAFQLPDVLPGALENVSELAKIVDYAPMISVQALVPKVLMNRPDGFGVLIPPKEGFDCLGILFNDSIFPNRVRDEGLASLTFLYGGARNRSVIQKPEDQLIRQAHLDASKLLGLKGEFLEVHCLKIPHAIPQYTARLGEFWELAHRALVTHNWNAVHQWMLFGNFTGQVSLRGIADGAQRLADMLSQTREKRRQG